MVFNSSRRLSLVLRFLLAFVSATGVMGSALWGFHGTWQGMRFVHGLGALALIQALYYVVQTLQWLRYREVPLAQDPQRLPTLAVVIPAYNEGAMVARSIGSVLAADYPQDKLRVLVVDDGSQDDTFAHIQAAAEAHPGRVETLRFAKNCGKRAALRAGFERCASAQILATLDSDSVINANTLVALVSPFVAHPQVGAVAGSVKVLNRNNWLGRMLDVRYYLSFNFNRAAQSTYGAVFVCPGALSAFRSELVVPKLAAWCGQSFFGRSVCHGEDQALTNIVLRQGYHTVFAASAVVHTLVPTSYGPLCRMYARWERSFIVEGLSFCSFMFTRYRTGNRFFPALHIAMEVLRLAMLAGFALALPGLSHAHLSVLLQILSGVVLAGLWSGLLVLASERNFRFVFGVAYAVFSLLFLQWIFPYALLTVRDERWGTR